MDEVTLSMVQDECDRLYDSWVTAEKITIMIMNMDETDLRARIVSYVNSKARVGQMNGICELFTENVKAESWSERSKHVKA